MQLVVMFSAQRQQKVMRFVPFHPDRGLSGGGDHQQAFHNMHGCVLTQRVYFSLTQRRRFGRNIKTLRRLRIHLQRQHLFAFIPDDAGGRKPKEQGHSPG